MIEREIEREIERDREPIPPTGGILLAVLRQYTRSTDTHPFSDHCVFTKKEFERGSCLLVLNSVSSTPPCIRQPKAAYSKVSKSFP